MATDTEPEVEVYSMGFLYLSCCVPDTMSEAEVESSVNELTPSGTIDGWQIANERFRTGEPNPNPCPDKPGKQHWLLNC